MFESHLVNNLLTLISRYGAILSWTFLVVNNKKEQRPDRHRHTVQLAVKKKERGYEGRDKPEEEVQEIRRTEAAHLILTVLSKLGQAWRREPQKLPGWKDSL